MQDFPRSRATLVAAALSLLLPGLAAQQPAPQSVLGALDASAGTVQDLDLPTTREAFRLSLVLGGQPVTLDLRPNDVRSSDFRLVVADAAGLHVVPTPASVTWRGEIMAMADTRVAASITDEGMDALIWAGPNGTTWCVQPARRLDPTRPAGEHVVYATADLRPQPVTCGTDHRVVDQLPPASASFGTDARKVAEIAFDCDLEYYQRFNSNVTQVQNQVTSIMNGVDTIYQRDIDVEYRVTTIIVRTVRTYYQTNMSNLLFEFRNHWNSTQSGTARDVAHLFTGKGSFSGVIGITQLGVVCNRSSAYGVDKAFSNSYSANVALVSHELGHDWNAPHCDSSNDCRIMCSGLGGCSGNITGFGQSSRNTMISFKNSRSCLDDPNPPTITSVTPTQAQAFALPMVTLTGTNLGGASQVRFGNLNATFSVVDSATLNVNAPVPTALGNTTVQVVSSVGSSNTVPFDYLPTDPVQLTAPAIGVSGYPIAFRMGSQPDDLWWMVVALNDPTTFSFLGYDILLNHVILASGQLDGVGLGSLDFPVPANANLAGLQLSSQIVVLDDSNLQLTDVSSVKTVSFVF